MKVNSGIRKAGWFPWKGWGGAVWYLATCASRPLRKEKTIPGGIELRGFLVVFSKGFRRFVRVLVFGSRSGFEGGKEGDA